MSASSHNTSKHKKSRRNDSADSNRKRPVCCPVAGIGASAGGLAAFKTFFKNMPEDSGMAFVLVPHLDPSHQSLMVDLLSRQTTMPVCEIQNGMSIDRNHVYVIPPAKYLSVQNDHLSLSTPPEPSRLDTAIDYFLRSLAQDQQERAIGIILSGTSSHGSVGLQAIKANGGMVMVQRPDTAEYDAMPQNAIKTGIVDYILSPAEMPATLSRYVQHAYVSGAWAPLDPAPTELEQLDRVLGLLKAHTKYDFRYYRKNMILRRVQRRMGLNQIDQLVNYSEFLRKKPDEASNLLRDLLIGVTGFFREPEAYRILQQRVIPQWIKRKDDEQYIRIWIPGCATGEEAYSLAMLIVEAYTEAHTPLKLQIFASDIDETALEFARHGLYPVSAAADIPPERLRRFFTLTGSHYQVNKQIRELVVFAEQNLISDAPFSKLDLISCRNLLIYLEPEVQQKVISLFHFALNEDGHLFLGSSETVGRHVDLFETVSKKWRVFRRVGPTRRDIVDFPVTSGFKLAGLSPSPVNTRGTPDINFAELTRRHLLDDYAPASVLISRKYEVLYFQGPTGDFLEAPTGQPTHDLIAMSRQGLPTKLRAACHKAIQNEQLVSDSSARVKHNNHWQPCIITVKPIIEPKQAEGLLLVTFQKLDIKDAESGLETEASPVEESSLVRQLEYELKVTRDDLQSTIEDMESSNEELKASNEEIMSMNEELQSANEELETSKEELQSLNEELSTVNSQLQDKVDELDNAHNDMSNLLNSAEIATLFLDTDLCIRQFTSATGKLLGLLSSDIGRPISTFATDFSSSDMLQDAARVLQNLTPLENEFHVSSGAYYLRRIQPFRTADNRIEGLVITFFNITRRVEGEQQSRRMATILHDSDDAITLLDLDGKISAWNRGAEKLYGYTEAEAQKMTIYDLLPKEQQDDTREYLKRITQGESITSLNSDRLTKDGRLLTVWITVTALHNEAGQTVALATIERDISERLQLDELKVQTERLLNMVEHLPAGAVYLEKDRLRINRATEEITGYSRHELTTPDQWFNRLYGERAAENRHYYEQERKAGFSRQSDPTLLTRKNGEQRYIEYAGYKYEDREVWILYDVTQRHLSESALHDREERLQAVMNNAAEAIVVIGLDGVITDFNLTAQKIFGYAANEAIGRNVSLLMPSPYREEHDGYLARYKKHRVAHIINQPREMSGMREDGLIFPMELTVTEVDHLGAYVGLIRDLSEQKALERQIARLAG